MKTYCQLIWARFSHLLALTATTFLHHKKLFKLALLLSKENERHATSGIF